MFMMLLISIKQGILAEETLTNLWSFAKSTNFSTLQSFPPYGNTCNTLSPLVVDSGVELRH